MNHSVNKWQQNKLKCIQGSLSGTQQCDIWHLLSYRYSLSLWSAFFFLLCLPPSLALSTLSRSLAHREWVTWNELSHRRLCFQPERGSMWSSVMPDSQHNQAFRFHRHLREPLISKTDGWLLAVTLLMSVKSSWAQRPNQLARSDALLCLLHLATSAIILNLKRSVNNLTINCR